MTSSSICSRPAASIAVLSLVALAACGGADSAPAKAPAQEQGPTRDDADGMTEDRSEPRTVEEAQERIARARARLEGGDAEKRPAAEPSPHAPQPAPEPPSAPQGGTSSAPRREVESTCASPCRALASMKRAVDALCRMTGETDDRCVEAKRTLGDSTTRVSSCKCE